MNEAGVSRESLATRDAAGCSRSCRTSKSRPSPSGVNTTISPSRTIRAEGRVATAAATSGKYREKGSCWRLERYTPPPSRKAMDRKPSHFGSNCQPGPSGSAGTAFASMGAMGGWNGRSIRGGLEGASSPGGVMVRACYPGGSPGGRRVRSRPSEPA